MANFKITFVGILLALSPGISFAADPCASLTRFSSTLDARIDARRSQFDQTVTDNLVRIREQEQSEDSKLFLQRKAEDTAIAERIAVLHVRTVTEEDRKALALFSSSLSTALRARRNGTDDAILRFRSSLRAVITAREEQGDGAIEAMRTDALRAVAGATEACKATGTVDPSRETLRTDLARITHDFSIKRDALETGDTSLALLRDARDHALQVARDTYLSAVAEASRALRASVSFSTDLSE